MNDGCGSGKAGYAGNAAFDRYVELCVFGRVFEEQLMRICYFVSEYPAVSHTFIRREIIELERIGFDVIRVSLRRNNLKLVDQADLEESNRTRYILEEGPLEYILALGASLRRHPQNLFKSARQAIKMMKRSHRSPIFHFAYLAEAIVLSRWLLSQDIRHIHAHFGTNNAEVAMLAHLLTGIPYSFTVHGPDEFDRPEYLGFAEKVKHAAFVCAVSSFTSSQICRWVPSAEWKKIKVIRCGLDADYMFAQLTAKVSNNHLVCVGRLSQQKGHSVLLNALATLAKRGTPFNLTLAGDGPLGPELRQQIRELGLDGQVEMTGWLSNSEIRDRILNARAVVLPSLAEGLPVVLMEALALGRPVITTYIAGIPELVVDGACGWLVPAGNADQLSQAIESCINAPDFKVQAMGKLGRERVLKMHDIAREGEKLGSLFRGFDAPHGSSQYDELEWTSRAVVDTPIAVAAG